MRKSRKESGNLRVGKADVRLDAASHVPGVPQGNALGGNKRERGLEPKGRGATGTARRSTSINPHARNPIDPRSPNLSPS